MPKNQRGHYTQTHLGEEARWAGRQLKNGWAPTQGLAGITLRVLFTGLRRPQPQPTTTSPPAGSLLPSSSPFTLFSPLPSSALSAPSLTGTLLFHVHPLTDGVTRSMSSPLK